jgi:Holliday junction resolvase-like predicted endonuclease
MKDSNFSRMAILVLSQVEDKPLSVCKISERTRTSIEMLDSFFSKISEDGLVRCDGESVSMTQNQRIRLAVKAVYWGANPKSVCRHLSWNEFEDFVVSAIEASGYETFKHFRFKHGKRRYEIDILGQKKPFMLSVDCKHWKRSWQSSATKNMVISQIKRTKALVSSLNSLRNRLRIEKWSKISVVPLIITLSETPYRIFHGTPVVPVVYLQDFLSETYLYDQNITKIEVEKNHLNSKRIKQKTF